MNKWNGGESPVNPVERVNYRLRDGSVFHARQAGELEWEHGNALFDIVEWELAAPLARAGLADSHEVLTFGSLQAVEAGGCAPPILVPALGNTDANGEGKQTNPKDMVGARKAPLSTLPFRVLWRVGLAMLEGMVKYGRHNYRHAGTRASVYFDGAMRHIGAWWEGEDIDPDSGFHHLDKLLADVMVLRDSMLQGNWVDDRPPRAKEDFVKLHAEAARIIDLHKDKSPRHFTIADSREAA